MDIVIVDDRLKVRNGLNKLLDGRGNWHITGTYASAMDTLKNMVFYSPDIIIIDIKMPGINGLNMIDRMRETDREACIVILSGYSDFGFAQRAIKLRVTRYLAEPTKRRELLGILGETEGKMSEKQKGDEEKKKVLNLMVQKAMNCITFSHSGKVNLKNIAEEPCLSPNCLSELSKRHTDKNISEYITQFRLDKTRRYLQQPKYKIAGASDLVDFGSPRYFGSIFKCQYGMTPNGYRNRNVK